MHYIWALPKAVNQNLERVFEAVPRPPKFWVECSRPYPICSIHGRSIWGRIPHLPKPSVGEIPEYFTRVVKSTHPTQHTRAKIHQWPWVQIPALLHAREDPHAPKRAYLGSSSRGQASCFFFPQRMTHVNTTNTQNNVANATGVRRGFSEIKNKNQISTLACFFLSLFYAVFFAPWYTPTNPAISSGSV